MKRLLLIICLLPVLAFGQFSGAKKLLLQQGEYCEYGNLAEYNQTTIRYMDNDGYFDTVAEAKQAIDNYRNGINNGLYGSGNYAIKTIEIGSYVLDSPLGVKECDLANLALRNYVILGTNLLNPTYIISCINGVITYKELY